jgi:hypothetical protein
MARSSFQRSGGADHLHRRRLATHAELLAVLLVTVSLVAASPSEAQTTLVHRVNAGGPAVEADPPWTADTAAGPSPFLIGTASTFATTLPIDLSHPSVPPGTPQALFQTERWDPAPSPEMAWEFPVDAGLYEVRLYFADIYLGTQAPGARVFDLSIENAVVLDDYDIFADVGGFRGVMKSFTVTSDGVLDVDFGHVVENPKISAIEILPAAPSLGELLAVPSALSFGQVVVGQTVTEPVQVRNAGSPGDPAVTVEATAITGAVPGAFSDDFDDGGQVTLVPGATATIRVTFAPITPGTQGATLEIAHSGTGSPLAVGLSGDGIGPVPSPLPTVIPPPATPEVIARCLTRPSITVLPANPTAGLTGSFPDDHTFDALDQVNTLYWDVERPVDVTTGLRPCWVGGIYIGTQSRDETWEAVKDVGGSAVRIRNPGGAYVAGFQADNHHDAFQFRSTSPTDPAVGDGWVFEHSYVTYNRDDVIENDDLLSGTVRDVLWDGTHVGFSAARDGSQPDQSTERIVFEDVLIRLQEMPSARYGMDHGHLLKWSSYAPRPVIRNSVFFIEDNHAGEWPPGTVLENVTLVWDPSSGSAPSLEPMPGLTITTDMSVWENAKQRWLERHGCTSFGNCARLLNPTA